MLTACLIGLGRIGMGFEKDPLRAKPASHLGALTALKDSITVQAFIDSDENALKQGITFYTEQVASPKVPLITASFTSHKDYIDYVNSPGQIPIADIIVVATPSSTHYQIMQDFLVSPKKPKLIFCEKPLAETSQDAGELVRLSEEVGVSLCVNHTRRWEPNWQYVKGVLNRNEVGTVNHFIGIFSGDKWAVGIHMADLARWFSIPIDNPAGYWWQLLQVGYGYLLFEVHLIGSEGRIIIKENGRTIETELPQVSDRYENTVELKPWRSLTPTGATPGLARAYQNIINHIEKGEALNCTGEDGLEAVRIVEEQMDWW